METCRGSSTLEALSGNAMLQQEHAHDDMMMN